MAHKILIVEDDHKTAALIRLYLERDGYRVTVAGDGEAGLETARHLHPDLVILDLMLPKMDGLSVCRQLRSEANVAIIMLTARSTEDDKLVGLDWGADDYITKPFSPRELVARVRVVLRRTLAQVMPLYYLRCAALQVDFTRYTASLNSEPLHLTPAEFKLLAALARQPGRPLTRLQLLEAAFGLNHDGLERTIDVHMKNLRKKIELDPAQPCYVQTVVGVGYKLAEEAEVE